MARCSLLVGAVGFLRSGGIAVGGSGDNIHQVNRSSFESCADYYEGVNSNALFDVRVPGFGLGFRLRIGLLSSG